MTLDTTAELANVTDRLDGLAHRGQPNLTKDDDRNYPNDDTYLDNIVTNIYFISEKIIDPDWIEVLPPYNKKKGEYPGPDIDRLEKGVTISEKVELRLSDIIGQPEAVEEARQIVDQINHPDVFTKWGAPMSRGLFLHGPGGTGKTLLARAIAGEADCVFTHVRSSDINDSWVGSSEKRARAIFDNAKVQATQSGKKVIIYFDEVDAIIPANIPPGDPVGKQVRHEILQGIEGFTGRDENIIIIASTNHPDNVDPQFRSRMGTKIEMGLPSDTSRDELFKYFLKGHISRLRKNGFDDLIEAVDYSALIEVTEGLSHRDIADIVDEVIRMKAYAESQGKPSHTIDTSDVLIAISKKRKLITAEKSFDKGPIGFDTSPKALTS